MLGDLDATSDRAVFRQIADQVRAAISGGSLREGDKIPSEAQLLERYGVARMTVRQALQLLQAEGLLIAEHGRGVFVRARPPVVRLSAGRFSRASRNAGLGAFAAEMIRQGRVPRQEILEIAEVRPPALVAERLHVDGRSKVLVRRRRMFADDVPLQLADSYVPVALARGTSLYHEDSGPGGTYARIEELGHRLVRATEELMARLPTPEERRWLSLGASVPVVHLIRTAFDSRGVPVEVFDSVVVAESHVFVYDVPMD
jgi:GntR family transcriptional regulator